MEGWISQNNLVLSTNPVPTPWGLLPQKHRWCFGLGSEPHWLMDIWLPFVRAAQDAGVVFLNGLLVGWNMLPMRLKLMSLKPGGLTLCRRKSLPCSRDLLTRRRTWWIAQERATSPSGKPWTEPKWVLCFLTPIPFFHFGKKDPVTCHFFLQQSSNILSVFRLFPP